MIFGLVDGSFKLIYIDKMFDFLTSDLKLQVRRQNDNEFNASLVIIKYEKSLRIPRTLRLIVFNLSQTLRKSVIRLVRYICTRGS